MSVRYEKSNTRMLNLLAAGLLMATALTTVAVVTPITPVRAEVHAAIDPSHGFADLVDQVMPSVISVQVKYANVAAGTDGNMPAIPDLPPDSPFRDFFKQFQNGNPGASPQQHGGMALGSGFIISSDGYAVTNNHVVKDAAEVSVKTQDGTEYQAKVIGTDPKTDLALIKIKSDKTFSFVRFASAEPRVGDWVMAVGNPFGLSNTVTTGIISARGRDIGAGPYDNFLQIDASINHGNSGGPAFNLDGEVVGVNTAIFSPSGGSVGIGFAIPASTAQSVIESLKTNGSVTRGWLGVQIQPVTPDIAESMGLKSDKGAIVADVTQESPALAAGLKIGDTIVKVDGKDIADARDLAMQVAQIAPGKSVPVTIVRNGKTMDVAVKIGTMPSEPKLASAGGTQAAPSLSSLGIDIAPAQDGAGVLVTAVDPNGPAADQGLKQGDVILEVAGKEVHAPADVRDAIKASGKKRVLMLVRSGDGQRFLSLPTSQG
jgi:serine protease Do